MKPVKFNQLKVGQEFLQTQEATEADIKTEPKTAHVKSGYTNCIGKIDKIRAHINENATVWVTE